MQAFGQEFLCVILTYCTYLFCSRHGFKLQYFVMMAARVLLNSEEFH